MNKTYVGKNLNVLCSLLVYFGLSMADSNAQVALNPIDLAISKTISRYIIDRDGNALVTINVANVGQTSTGNQEAIITDILPEEFIIERRSMRFERTGGAISPDFAFDNGRLPIKNIDINRIRITLPPGASGTIKYRIRVQSTDFDILSLTSTAHIIPPPGFEDRNPVDNTSSIMVFIKPEIMNRQLASTICSGDQINIALSSSLSKTTYKWTISKHTDIVGVLEDAGKHHINQTLINDGLQSRSITYHVTPVVTAVVQGLIHNIDGNPKDFSFMVTPRSTQLEDINSTVVDAMHTSMSVNDILDDVTYSWYSSHDGSLLHQGMGIDGMYTIQTPSPGLQTYYLTTKKNNFCESERTTAKLTVKHYVTFHLEASNILIGDAIRLRASLPPGLVAASTLTIHLIPEETSSAKIDRDYKPILPIEISPGQESGFVVIRSIDSKVLGRKTLSLSATNTLGYTLHAIPSLLMMDRQGQEYKVVLFHFDEAKVSAGDVVRLRASLPTGVLAPASGISISLTLSADQAMRAMPGLAYKNLILNIMIPGGKNDVTIDIQTPNSEYIKESGMFSVHGNSDQYQVVPAKILIQTVIADVSNPIKPIDDPNFKIPNVFSPDSDNINDVWKILGIERYIDCNVKIFNRKEQLLFESDGYQEPWDGTFENKNVPNDAYFYIIDLKGGRVPLSGYVSIVR